MADEDTGSSNESSGSDTNTEALAANKPRANAANKTTFTDLKEKSANKEPSGNNDPPSADEVSIPASVDPDAPANTEGDNTDGHSGTENNE